jgi:MFS family permease
MTRHSSRVNQSFKSYFCPKIIFQLQIIKDVDYIWRLFNFLFLIGGMVGAFASKYVLERFGCKNGILFHNLFSVLGSLMTIISYYLTSPLLLLLGRIFFGVQGGMSCFLVPTYLNEISPVNLRGRTGVFHQLFVTLGIMVIKNIILLEENCII